MEKTRVRRMLLTMVCLIGLPFATLAQKQIFYESFNNTTGTGANDGSWKGSIASSTVVTDNEGWEFIKQYGAFQCIKLGTTKDQGSASTPAIQGVNDTAVLTFKAAAWDGDATKLTLSTSSGTLAQTEVVLVKGAWSTYTVALTGASDGVKITFQAGQKSKNRFFLDDVQVTVEGEGSGSTGSDDTPTTDDTDETVTAQVMSMEAFNQLAEGTVAQLYIADGENARVSNVDGNQALLQNAKGEKLMMKDFVKNPTMKVNQHVAGYIIGKKNIQDGVSVLEGIKKTNTHLLLIADPVTEKDIETAITKIENESRLHQGVIYDLQGVNRGTQKELLPSGVYILNGQKITIKK